MTMMIIMVRVRFKVEWAITNFSIDDWQFDNLALSEVPTPVVSSPQDLPTHPKTVQQIRMHSAGGAGRAQERVVARPSPLRSMMTATWVEDIDIDGMWCCAFDNSMY